MNELHYLYIAKLEDENESFYKIGVTSRENIKERLSTIPYRPSLVKSYSHPSTEFIRNLESKLISLGSSYKPTKEFAGITECVSNIDEIEVFLSSLDWIRSLKEHDPNFIDFINKQKLQQILGSYNFGVLAKKYTELSKKRNKDESELEIIRLIEEDPNNETLISYANIFGLDSLEHLEDASITEARLERKVFEFHQKGQLFTVLKNSFKTGSFYPNTELKDIIQNLCDQHGIDIKAKASDISIAFKAKKACRIVKGVKTHGLELESKKYRYKI